ncbi:MAG: hypothetical protein ACP5U1_03800, partial [Desulfomonilaceae bacterium]
WIADSRFHLEEAQRSTLVWVFNHKVDFSSDRIRLITLLKNSLRRKTATLERRLRSTFNRNRNSSLVSFDSLMHHGFGSRSV